MARSQEIPRRAERQARRDALRPKDIHHPSGGYIVRPHAPVQGTSDYPSARGREARVEDPALEAPQFTDDAVGLAIDETEGEVVADAQEEVGVPVQGESGYGGWEGEG